MLARILRNRDLVSDGEIDEYLNGGTDRLYDPFLMKGIKEAVPLIFAAIKNNERIRVIGDYDTDGVCSSYILKQFITALGGNAEDRKSTRLNSSHTRPSRMPSSA